MSPEKTLLPSQQTTPYVFQRLERVKACLSTDSLPPYLDATRKAWYLRTTTHYLAQRLLEGYRRLVEESINTTGIAVTTLRAKHALTISTDPNGETTVQLCLGTVDIERVRTTLSTQLEAGDHNDAWDTLVQRLAIDISTWALEQMDTALGSAVIERMSEATFDATLMTYAWPQDPAPLHDRVEHFLNLTAQQVAFDIATAIEARTRSLTELEQLLGLHSTTTHASRLQSLLREEHLTVLSAAHYHAVREALYKNTFQRFDGIPWPTALLATGHARGHAELRPIVVEITPLMPPEEINAWAQRMWQQREELTDLDADALDALSALWLYQAHTPQDDAVVDVDELLAMRELQPKQRGRGRRGGYEPEQRMRMLQALGHIQNLWLNMSEVEVYESHGTRRRKPTKQAVQSRAFTITDFFGQLRPDGFMDVKKFIFRPGKVFAHFLYGTGRQTALLSARALVYDPYRQLWEKRLTRYLSWQWRTRAHTGNYLQPYRVDTLLEAARQKVNPRRLAWQRTRLEKTLDTIQEDNVVGAWQYQHLDEEDWSRSTVLLEPPDIIQETYQRIARHETSKRQALPMTTALGERLKRRRQSLGLSQIQAAEQLEISQTYFSLLECGKKTKHSAALNKKIRAWLGES